MNKKKFKELRREMQRLMEKENDRMIRQNEIERKREVGKSCFDTAMRGSKIFRKIFEK